MYHDQIFRSTQSFIEAFNNGTLIRHPEQADPKADYSWPERQRKKHDRDLDYLPGPRSVSFAGLRYRVDRERQYISWLGWGLYLGFNRDMGLNLWDIRFRGERIVYQVETLCLISFQCLIERLIGLACSSRGHGAIRLIFISFFPPQTHRNCYKCSWQ